MYLFGLDWGPCEAIGVVDKHDNLIGGVVFNAYQPQYRNIEVSFASIRSDWLTTLSRSSSYVVADSGWKYQFDKYNNTYRWIPLNGDIAGLCVYTDNIRDPWFSPAGFNRGAIKNCIKLAWNPNKSFRDTLYAAGVNPVVSFPGQGTVLFGDKTMLSKPSAFDRINVRRLFIVLEKAIARAARFSMFNLTPGIESISSPIVVSALS